MLSKREFYEDSFYVWALQQYEEARVFLKRCGRPMNEYDKYLISEARWTCTCFKQFID